MRASPGATTPPGGRGDPGCLNATAAREDPLCQDGLDNDGDGFIDHDAGLSANGMADPAGADPQCVDRPWRNNESPTPRRCGLAFELALLLAPLAWARGRRRWRAV